MAHATSRRVRNAPVVRPVLTWSQENRIPVSARDTDIYIGTTLTLQPLSQSRSWYGRVSLLGIATSKGERSNAVDLPTNEPRSIPETGNCDATELSPEEDEEEEEEEEV